MGIWVRSQNEVTLIYCTDIYIANGGEGSKIKSGHFVLGRYDTKEQAMFVMGSIEEHINNSHQFVFDMPTVEDTEAQIAEMDVYFTPVDRK